MAYLTNWTDNFFQIFFMGTSWVAVSINNIKTRASSEMTSRKNIKIFDFNGVNVAKHWHVAGRGICHLWLPCCTLYLCVSQLRVQSSRLSTHAPPPHPSRTHIEIWRVKLYSVRYKDPYGLTRASCRNAKRDQLTTETLQHGSWYRTIVSTVRTSPRILLDWSVERLL